MLNWIIAVSLKNRATVLALTVLLALYGGYKAAQLPIDVFPDLNRPTVTIMAEAHGLAPEEVETLVTRPIEAALNGATNVLRVRSASGIGISIVWVEFEWGTDIYVDRQIVNEKLQTVTDRLPADVETTMTPISSIMGEIMLLGLQSEGKTTPIELRTLAEWTLRQRLLAISGVSQVTVMGGELKQYQVLTSPARLAQYDVTLNELTTAVEQSNIVTGGGFLLDKEQEKLIRIVGRATSVAIGELVDDSIVDIENIYRRLKENRHKAMPDNPLKVIFLASAEVRNSIVYATLIVVLVVFPLFSLAGLEGRLFAPLGLSYVVTLAASLVVSLTVTPVLASYLLPGAKFLEHEEDPFLLRGLKYFDRKLLRFALRHAYVMLGVVAVLVVVSVSTIAWMGGEFLPEFNEGTLTIGAEAPPSTSLEESDRLGTRIEKMLLEIPEVTRVSRRTGRAEMDEHAENVNFSEIDVGLMESEQPKPGLHNSILRGIPGLHGFGVVEVGRPREVVLAEIRDKLSGMPGMIFNIGQPISHRLDHIMSGIRSQVAVKLYGEELPMLRSAAYDIRDLMAEVPGVVDLRVEPQVDIPQVRVTVRRYEAIRRGLAPGDVAHALETAFQGTTVNQVLEGQRTFDLVVWFDEQSRNNIDAIRSTMITAPDGSRVALATLADVEDTAGPNTINRENVQRRIVVSCNVADRDLASVVGDIQTAVEANILPKLPPRYFVGYGGQFEAQQAANLRLLLLGGLSLVGVFLLLVKCLGSWRAAVQVMVNIPLAAIGSVIALLLFNQPSAEALAAASWWEWPRVWIEATSLSVAHWVGFITLIGIVCRNGIMMISHYIHLMQYEGEKFDEHMIIRGSLERLAPVLMTALTAIIGLVPLAMGAGQTGKEILHPLAIVVIGGLISSTLLDQIVTPALFYKFGRKVYEHKFDAEHKAAPADDLSRLAAQFV